MTIGDRVKIGGTGILSNAESNLVVYGPQTDANGDIIFDHNGIASVKRLGFVKPGSLGTIQGHPIRVLTSQLIDKERTQSLASGGYDIVDLFPVFLDHYQQLGWFPSDQMRIYSGPEGMDRS